MIDVDTMLARVKQAARIKTTVFDELQLTDLINAAQADLGVAGVIVPDEYDYLVGQAIVTYCLMNFGLVDEYDRLKKSYDEQKAQLVTCTGYTDWLKEDGDDSSSNIVGVGLVGYMEI